MASGSITATYDDSSGSANDPKRVRTATIAWTSASGTVSQDIATLNGVLIGMCFKPSGGGTAPTDGYDVTLLDAQGADVLGGGGADCSATVAARRYPETTMADGTTKAIAAVPINGVTTFTVANAGTSKQGTCVLYYKC